MDNMLDTIKVEKKSVRAISWYFIISPNESSYFRTGGYWKSIKVVKVVNFVISATAASDYVTRYF